MSARFVNELVEGTRVSAAFVMRAKELRLSRTGDAYLRLDLGDRTGTVPALLFRPSSEAVDVPAGTVVDVTGTVSMFRGQRRISVESLHPAGSWNSTDFLPTSARSREELVAEFRQIVKSIEDEELRAVLRALFGDKVLFERFTKSPASQTHHHAYLGGLIEHTISVARQCSLSAQAYAGVDRDLLVTAALLHDIGKLHELTFDTSISYTDEGRLVGHVVLGDRMIAAASARTRVGAEKLARLQHAVLSHHGELEWGAPKRPSTIEALLLHHIDNLDAKAAGFTELVAGAAAAQEAWTDASNMFRRPLHAPRSVEDDRPGIADEDAVQLARTA